MKNRFVIVDDETYPPHAKETSLKDSDETHLKKTEALTFEGAYGELTSSGGNHWAPVKTEILKNKGEKNRA